MLFPLHHVDAVRRRMMNPMFGRVFRHIEWFLSRCTRNTVFTIAFVFFFALALRTSLLPIVPAGIPALHDEYSYLLQADTFASGHLAMPTHPMWEHFQTFHVLQKPTYASKFFPGQATFLALGEVLFGHPWWGVALSVAGMCAAMVWCLAGFFSPGWAFWGGMITALQFGTTHYWGTAYYGGAVAAIGGCLAVGATGRLLRAANWRASILFGVGASILAASRPFEGCVLCLVLLTWLALAAWRQGQARFASLLCIGVPPLALALALGGVGLLYFNHMVTGDAFTFPYVAYTKQYDAAYGTNAPEDLPFPADMPQEMRRYHTEWGYPAQHQQSTLRGKINSLPHRFDVFCSILFPIFFLPALLAPLVFFASKPARAPFLAVMTVLTSSLFFLWSQPHYFAPALGLFSVLWLHVFRWVRTVKLFGRPVGLSVVRLLPLVLLFSAILSVHGYPLSPQNDMEVKATQRQHFENKLKAIPGNHLVVVTYGPDSNVHAEWVYNRADIDHSRVVWARDLGSKKNGVLFAYFKDRQHWCANVTATRTDFGPCKADKRETSKP